MTYFSGVRLVLLYARIAPQAHVIVHVEVEQRAALAASACHY